MTDAELQRKLNRLTVLANEVHAEARRRYGKYAGLFYESEGHFNVMTGLDEGSAFERQKMRVFCSEGVCRMDCGAW